MEIRLEEDCRPNKMNAAALLDLKLKLQVVED